MWKRKETKRKEAIKEILLKLHQGHSPEEVKELFRKNFDGVSALEISKAEMALIEDGVPVEEIQKLCDVHAAVFEGSIEEIHGLPADKEHPGHPANIIIAENKYFSELINARIYPALSLDSLPKDELSGLLEELRKIDTHYSRKENVIFPYLEKHGITAPPKVMWGVDDEIRAELKESIQSLQKDNPEAKEQITTVLNKIEEMFFKEESILIPMLFDTLTTDEWREIAQDSYEIGFVIDSVPVFYKPAKVTETTLSNNDVEGEIRLPSGVFTVTELVNVLNNLPFDITFVDKNDRVRYFSESSERIFPRTRSVIGRSVSNCHPPASVHIVEKLVEDFKAGVKDHEDFWIKMGDRYILIRYFAVRDEAGEYIGVLEVSQDIKPLQEITGEKRLMS